MTKHLCKLSQSVKKNFETIAGLVDRPRFICTDCGRAANEKKRVCEPKRMPESRGGAKAKDKVSPASGE
jgi:hypothetical protein